MKMPAFANEDEEAQWWFDHRGETGHALVEASQQGRNCEGSLGRRARKLAEIDRVTAGQREAVASHK
jgi:hypothetical protein